MASVSTMSASNGEYPLGSSARPVISIDRLPVRRVSNEPREAMNCKSCRKRKIKCTRVRPVCEACTTFNCACIYDAIPQKRGPKTGLTEGTTRRNSSAAKRLKTEAGVGTVLGEASIDTHRVLNTVGQRTERRDSPVVQPEAERIPSPQFTVTEPQTTQEDGVPETDSDQAAITLPRPQPHQAPKLQSLDEILLNVYFTRLHGKPFYVLDEVTTRMRQSDGSVAPCISMAVRAVSIKYSPQLCGGYAEATRLSQEWLVRSRADIDVDEPTVEHVQALLLLALAAHQHGNGKKSCMLLAHAISMAVVLGLHREPIAMVTSPEQTTRRSLFWSCYLMDRFAATGSKRPALIADDCVSLQVDPWQRTSGGMHGVDTALSGGSSQVMLVRITKILGETNRYLAAGGVKGDSHFPWHAQSTLSKLRAELDMWASNTHNVFKSLDSAFGLPDRPTLVLSKLVYHLIHCLIYRPFLPIDLTELTGSGQNQSWQIEATNICFVHANAIAEMAENGRTALVLDWSSFVGYCLSTAGTIHVHGAHYFSATDGSLAVRSADYLSRVMVQLTDLRLIWAGVQHQLNTLKLVYTNHALLVKSLADNPMRYAPVFQMEDFFARYPGVAIDSAHVNLADVTIAPELAQQSIHETRQYDATPMFGWPHPAPDGQQSDLPPTLEWVSHQPSVVGAPRSKNRRVEDSAPFETPVTASGGGFGSLAPGPSSRQLQTPDQASYHWPQTSVAPFQAAEHGRQDTLPSNAQIHIPHFTDTTFQQMPTAYQLPSQNGHSGWQYMYTGQEQQTPGAFSMSAGSMQTVVDEDPFLMLLGQMAEHDGMQDVGLGELDSFLHGGQG